MYKKVLLTLDGSELSALALPHAVQIASASGAEIVLMRVIDSVAHVIAQAAPTGIEAGPGLVTAELAQEAVAGQRIAAERDLTEAAQQLNAQGINRVSVEVVEGVPGDAVVETAQRLGCDLIVMATHGRGGLGRVLLGSVADHVVRHARSAVLLVRPPEEG
jgi:nucleotide-binding universal stress UspA family protein